MDDVGQTLLNWASAFGTQEMVEYLCQKGADVNKGQRSSSLHYAACFGRPQIAKVLLRFGANPDLRDEDGKTPLDKARERNDEGHREVASILQSPADWITSPSTEDTSAATASEEEQQPSIADQGKARFVQEGIFFALNLFAGKILLIKKLEIEKTKPTFMISVLDGVSFFDFQLF